MSFWGEKMDEKVEGFIRNYVRDVYSDLSEIILKMTKRGMQRNGILLPCFFNVLFPESFDLI